VLSEEALILAAVAGACVLLVLGVLELVWPTRPRRARRSRVEPAAARPVAAAPPRPAQSILPRRLIDSPSASRPAGGFVFPPPADYVPPPLPREEVRPIRLAEPAPPIRPIGVVRPSVPAEEEAEPVPEPVLPAYIPPPAIEVEPEPIEPAPAPVEAEPLALEPEPRLVEPDSCPLEPAPRLAEPEPSPFEAEPQPFEPEPQPLEPEPQPLEPEPRPLEPEPSGLEPEPPSLVPEPPRFEPEPPPRFEPDPPMVEARSPVVEPEATPVEAPPPPITPERQPIALIAPPLEPATPPLEQAQPPLPAEPPAPPKRRRRSKISPHARPHRVLRPTTQESRPAEPPATNLPAPAPPEAAAKSTLPPQSAPESAPAGIDAKLTRDSPLVERCFALYQEKRFDEVLSVGEQALVGFQRDATAGPSREAAALWSVVGLAKQALGDDDGAHAALASSVDAAFETERSTYRRHLTTHALEAAQARLARAASHDPGDRMEVIRSAIVWTERGLAAVPSDPALSDTREASHDALWQAYEQAATTLLQRQEFPVARQILHEALDDPKLPTARAAGFRGLLSGTFGGEIGQLTAQAILSMQEGRESEALGVLQRADDLLRAIPPDTLPPTRRDEVDQRLWWAYAELGSRRLDAGDYEEALDPLVHALRFTSIGPERQAETRAAVVRTLEGIAAVRALSIRRLAEAGSRDEAIVAAGELHALVKRGVELGITEDELVAAFARVRRLCEELGMDARG
jgi:tetratricopeptide (TPR) repeat protein